MKYTFNNTQPKDAVKIGFIAGDEKIAGDYLALDEGKQILRIALPKGDMTRRKFILLGRKVVALARKYKVRKIFIDFQNLFFRNFPSPKPSLRKFSQQILKWRILSL